MKIVLTVLGFCENLCFVTAGILEDVSYAIDKDFRAELSREAEIDEKLAAAVDLFNIREERLLSEAKPCPFCGSNSLQVHTPPAGYKVILCNDCAAEGPTTTGSDEEACRLWNGRIK